jgi:hypothetical protein
LINGRKQQGQGDERPMPPQIEDQESHRVSATSHRARYQGKQLLSLMLALCVPAALLYLRLVLGLAASQTTISRAQADTLNRWATVAWVAFLLSQLIAARYVQRKFLKPASRVRDGIQFIGVLLSCILFSLTGAIVLESFGWNVFLRFMG